MIRTLQRELYTKAKQATPAVTRSMIEHRFDILSRASKRRSCKCACFGVKNIGKLCALIAHARFDEGGQAKSLFSTRAPGRAHLLGGESPLHTRQGEV